MNWKNYVAKLSSDNGNHYLSTTASSKERATNIIMSTENCPKGAIDIAEIVNIENVKKGDYLRRKIGAKKTYIRGGYNRSTRAYECQNFADISDFIYIKKGKQVFINFEF